MGIGCVRGCGCGCVRESAWQGGGWHPHLALKPHIVICTVPFWCPASAKGLMAYVRIFLVPSLCPVSDCCGIHLDAFCTLHCSVEATVIEQAFHPNSLR